MEKAKIQAWLKKHWPWLGIALAIVLLLLVLAFLLGRETKETRCAQTVCAGGSVDQAYKAASPGSVITLEPGSYGPQTIAYDAGKATASSRVVIEAAGARFSKLTMNGAQALELHDPIIRGSTETLLIVGSGGKGWDPGDKPARNIVISGDGCDIQTLLFRNVKDVTVADCDIGGFDQSTTCGSGGCGVPKVGAYVPEGGATYQPSQNVVFDQVRFHDIIRTLSETSHAECFYADNGIDGLTIKRSVFTNCGVYDFFSEQT